MEQLIEVTERYGQRLDSMNERLDQIAAGANKSSGAFSNLGSAIKAALGFMSNQKVRGFVEEVFKLNNTQMTVEVQLATVLNNRGQGIDAFEQIRKKAADIQGSTMYGDEAMIAGAAEISTYISDPEAISAMMGTLSNYAAGMSGGGAADTSGMTEYATQLGKALDGTYDGLKKKGFELSEEQQKIIENGTDMEKALVLDEVISQSWAGLAENMRQTPTGMITSLNNAIGDMGEEIGARITPAFMTFMEQVEAFVSSSGFDTMLDTVVTLLTTLFGVLSFGMGIVQAVADNWGVIGPIVATVTAALVAYKTVTLLSAAVQAIFNGALLACPLTWIVVAVAAVIGVIAVLTEVLNSACGTSFSFAGMLGGILMAALAALGNLVIMIYNIVVEAVLAVWNNIAKFVNFFASVWSDPLGSVVRLFTGVFDSILSIVETVFGAIGSLFGQDWSSGIQGFRDQMNAAVEEQFGTGAVDVTVDEKMLSLDYIDYGEAFDAGYYLGDQMFGGGSESNAYAFDYDSLMNNPTGAEGDPIHTEVDNDINIADEDLQLMRDVAEARYVQNFVTLTPTVQVSGNTINEKADIGRIVDEIEYRLESEFAASAEGVYG